MKLLLQSLKNNTTSDVTSRVGEEEKKIARWYFSYILIHFIHIVRKRKDFWQQLFIFNQDLGSEQAKKIQLCKSQTPSEAEWQTSEQKDCNTSQFWITTAMVTKKESPCYCIVTDVDIISHCQIIPTVNFIYSWEYHNEHLNLSCNTV